MRVFQDRERSNQQVYFSQFFLPQRALKGILVIQDMLIGQTHHSQSFSACLGLWSTVNSQQSFVALNNTTTHPLFKPATGYSHEGNSNF